MAINQDRIDALIGEAAQRAVEQATVTYGRNPTREEVGFTMLQSQLATLISTVIDEEDIEAFWENVVHVTRLGRAGVAS